MKNILSLFLLAVMAMLMWGAVTSPALALSSEVADSIKDQAETVGRTAFGEQGGEGDLLTVRVAGIIKTVLGFVGVIVVVIIVYAGFLWMTAGGNSEQVSKAKQWIVNAIIGLAITLSAYAITDFVINKMIEASMSS